jgi:NADH-quinone oxidoreductase subunit L
LMHSATLVTAGVYLIARMNTIYQLAPLAMEIVAIFGALTAVYAATLALVQTDIKRILSYSTISQLGFMFLALGAGAFSAGIFQLLTHALFKALLFLAGGSLVFSLSGEQDIRRMGGMWNAVPTTSRPFLIATLAIAALPPFAGFFSENEILGQAFHHFRFVNPHIFLWLAGIIIAALTAIYSFRLLFLAFFGRSRVSPQLEVQIHESPQTMNVPLTVLAFLCIIGGWFALPVLWGEPNSLFQFLAPVLGEVGAPAPAVVPESHFLLKEYLLLSTPLLAAGLGIWLAYRIYLQKPKLRDKIPAAWPRLHKLLTHQYYFDQFYLAVVVNPIKDLSLALDFADAVLIDGLATNITALLARSLSRISAWCDKWIVGGAINFGAKFIQALGNPIRLLQTGVFSLYALWMLLGLTLLLGYYAHHMQVWMRTLH